MATCNINELLAEVAGIGGLTPGQRRIVVAKLLYDIAGETASVQDILSDASCFMCLTQPQLRMIQAQLLCNFSGSGGGGGGGGGYEPPVATGDIPNDSFEDYSSGEDLAELNGGENGVTPFIINWESVWVSQPWLVDVGSGEPPDAFFDLEVWVKADAIVGVNNNDALSTWEDQTANERDFTAVGAQRPTYQTNVQNGLPGVFFNNVGGVGMTGDYAVPANAPFTIMMVLKSNSLTFANRKAIQARLVNWMIYNVSGMVLQFDGDQENAYQGSTNCHVVVLTQTTVGTFTKTYLDGGEGSQSSVTQAWPGDLDLGATGFENAPMDGWIFEIAIYNRALLPSEAFSLCVNMINKWGI